MGRVGRPSIFTTFVLTKIVIDGYKCNNCGHIWIPRKKSSECPNCCRRVQK